MVILRSAVSSPELTSCWNSSITAFWDCSAIPDPPLASRVHEHCALIIVRRLPIQYARQLLPKCFQCSLPSGCVWHDAGAPDQGNLHSIGLLVAGDDVAGQGTEEKMLLFLLSDLVQFLQK